jgi:RNA polymerase-binding transcription factor DksA
MKRKTIKQKQTRIGKREDKKSDNKRTVNVKTPFSASELKVFQRRLLGIKNYLTQEISNIEDKSLRGAGRDGTGNLSNLPIHLADAGSDTYEQDFSLGLLEGEDIELKEIEESLERIENKTYGICEECSNPINENRLKSIPYARFCVKCKQAMEKK